jgi:glyoxylase-like metal-dependent hydrolase (beta-lactamase superfamily II)/rhodanese-related sulfurtransferase
MANTNDRMADLRRRPARGRTNAPVETTVAVADLEIEAFAGEFDNQSYAVRASAQTAFLIDPPRDASAHLRWAAERDLRIAAVLETHLHGDFVSGAREVEAAVGATVIAPAGAGLISPHRAVTDGWVVLIGDVEVHACAAPGHTTEHVMYVVTVDGTPAAVFGGGLLSPPAPDDVSDDDSDDDSDVDDETAPAPATASADIDLRRRAGSARDQLARLPEGTPLFLTHHESNGADDTAPATVGEALAAIAHGAVELVRREAGPHVAALRTLNRAGAPLVESLPSAEPLAAREVARLLRQGTWLVDVRAPNAWTAGHVPQGVSIAAGSQFRRLLPHAVPPGAPVVLLGDEHDVDECVAAAHACGHDGIIGWVDGSWRGWREADLPLRTTPVTSAHAPAWADAFGAATAHVVKVGDDISLADIAAGAVPNRDGPDGASELIVSAPTAAETATAASLLEARGHRVALRLPAE